jgi:hypothetical protein
MSELTAKQITDVWDVEITVDDKKSNSYLAFHKLSALVFPLPIHSSFDQVEKIMMAYGIERRPVKKRESGWYWCKRRILNTAGEWEIYRFNYTERTWYMQHSGDHVQDNYFSEIIENRILSPDELEIA